MHMSKQHCWFDIFNLSQSALAGKPHLYLLSGFSFHTVTPLFLYLCFIPRGNQVLGSGLQIAFRPCLFFSCFSISLTLSFFVSQKEKKG